MRMCRLTDLLSRHKILIGFWFPIVPIQKLQNATLTDGYAVDSLTLVVTPT